ncbi:uncharacterized protein LOC142323470 [Lycorma delicatula]|uniref:uncharacterized protein LOC142323470 n=1 Tax=Lycorma delicatula TaxID=130591 RepID=UPI003F513930
MDTTEEEITAALSRVLGEDEDFKLSSIRQAYGETKNVTEPTSLALSWDTALTERSDIIFVSEPPYDLTSGTGWLVDATTAAIGFPVSGIPIISSGSSDGFIWADLGEIVVFSCYNSPNAGIDNFVVFLENLAGEVMRHRGRKVLIAGDFNAKSPEFAGTVNSLRGRHLSEYVNTLGLTCINGEDKTFRRRMSCSAIDLAFTTSTDVNDFFDWRIINKESLSDHLFIAFESRSREIRVMSGRLIVSKKGCLRFRDRIILRLAGDMSPEDFVEQVQKECGKAGVLVYPRRQQHAYWWSPDLEQLRKAAWKARRAYQRSGRQNARLRDAAREVYVEARNAYNASIKRAKASCWKRLCQDIDADLWGRGFKIVTNKLGKRLPVLTDDKIHRVVKELFPQQADPIREEIVDNSFELLDAILEF